MQKERGLFDPGGIDLKQPSIDDKQTLGTYVIRNLEVGPIYIVYIEKLCNSMLYGNLN